jgi:hypothetical protein
MVMRCSTRRDTDFASRHRSGLTASDQKLITTSVVYTSMRPKSTDVRVVPVHRKQTRQLPRGSVGREVAVAVAAPVGAVVLSADGTRAFQTTRVLDPATGT